MPVFKRKYESGKTVWRYLFSAPGATREDRRLISEVGFASKQEAIDAEAKRRTEELQKFELAKAGAASVAAALPTTLGMLFGEFFRWGSLTRLKTPRPFLSLSRPPRLTNRLPWLSNQIPPPTPSSTQPAQPSGSSGCVSRTIRF
jgi:hypothetical protein